jgi:hypothetical protein
VCGHVNHLKTVPFLSSVEADRTVSWHGAETPGGMQSQKMGLWTKLWNQRQHAAVCKTLTAFFDMCALPMPAAECT